MFFFPLRVTKKWRKLEERNEGNKSEGGAEKKRLMKIDEQEKKKKKKIDETKTKKSTTYT